MKLPRVLFITCGVIHNGDRSERGYLAAWQREHNIPDGTAVILCPRDQAQKVEDFLESLRALQETRKNLTA